MLTMNDPRNFSAFEPHPIFEKPIMTGHPSNFRISNEAIIFNIKDVMVRWTYWEGGLDRVNHIIPSCFRPLGDKYNVRNIPKTPYALFTS